MTVKSVTYPLQSATWIKQNASVLIEERQAVLLPRAVKFRLLLVCAALAMTVKGIATHCLPPPTHYTNNCNIVNIIKRGKIMHFKKVLSLFLLVCTLLMFAPAVSAEGSNTAKLVILHTGDVHGSFVRSEDAIGHDYISTQFKAIKENIPATFLVDTGDATQGNFFVNWNLGEAAIEIMNTVGYDAMTLGNHDFDYEWERTLRLADLANFPLMTQESVIGDDPIVVPYTLIERGDYTVGFFGITSPETKQSSNGGFDRNFGTMEELIAYATATAANLRTLGADIVVCVSHLGTVTESANPAFGTCYDLSRGAKGIDLIIDGHSHTELDELVQIEGGIPISAAGSGGETLGWVGFYLEGGKLVPQMDSFTVDEMNGFEPDPAVTQVLEKWTLAAEEAGKEVVGNTPVAYDYNEELCRTEETPIGNLLSDALLSAAGADIAFSNGGNICAPLDAGDITRAEINEMLPYSNLILSADLSGSVVREVLEASVAEYPSPKGGFMQVAGLSFVFDPEKPAGERVVSVTVAGEALEDTKTYKVVTNDFIAHGGDGYDILVEPFMTATAVNPSDMTEILTNYIAQNSDTLEPKTDGRITKGSAPADTTPADTTTPAGTDAPTDTETDMTLIITYIALGVAAVVLITIIAVYSVKKK
jgi:5'-nucleotidase